MGDRTVTRLIEFISNPRNQIRWWATWTVLWLLLDPVTMLTPLSHSVPWLNQESLFANFASCGTALVAAWSYFRARNVDEKVDSAAHFEHIETVIGHVEALAVRIDEVDGALGSQLAAVLDVLRFPPETVGNADPAG